VPRASSRRPSQLLERFEDGKVPRAGVASVVAAAVAAEQGEPGRWDANLAEIATSDADGATQGRGGRFPRRTAGAPGTPVSSAAAGPGGEWFSGVY